MEPGTTTQLHQQLVIETGSLRLCVAQLKHGTKDSTSTTIKPAPQGKRAVGP